MLQDAKKIIQNLKRNARKKRQRDEILQMAKDMNYTSTEAMLSAMLKKYKSKKSGETEE